MRRKIRRFFSIKIFFVAAGAFALGMGASALLYSHPFDDAGRFFARFAASETGKTAFPLPSSGDGREKNGGNSPSNAPDFRPNDPAERYFIETLRALPPRGRDFKIKELLEKNAAYEKYSVSYASGDLMITGVMNIPFGARPDSGFPVLILNHGLIRPEAYYSGRGSRREQDFFARNGYVTIHPDYRGYASSTPFELAPAYPAAHHDFYQGYADDATALLDAVKDARLSFLDTDRIGMWGHSMGGGIAARVMAIRNDIKAYVLFAPISADAEDNFYELEPTEIERLHAAFGPAGAGVYRKISPIEYFHYVNAPVQIHHGTADADVPISFSRKMYDALKNEGKRADLFIYEGQKHEFIEAWQLAANRSLAFFDAYVKNSR